MQTTVYRIRDSKCSSPKCKVVFGAGSQWKSSLVISKKFHPSPTSSLSPMVGSNTDLPRQHSNVNRYPNGLLVLVCNTESGEVHVRASAMYSSENTCGRYLEAISPRNPVIRSLCRPQTYAAPKSCLRDSGDPKFHVMGVCHQLRGSSAWFGLQYQDRNNRSRRMVISL